MTTSVIRKSVLASIEPGADDATAPNGSFHIILSTPDRDRDGEELKASEWQQPLPQRITMDVDHGMSVASTVGSGVPSIEADGKLHVRGTYSSLPRAQDVRTLVKEGHITKTSVAFLRKTSTDAKGAKTTSRELLNGAFVAIPANDHAEILDSKGLDDAEGKEGRRNSGDDSKMIQAIHDHAAGLGAACPGGKTAAAAERKDGAGDDDPAALAQGVDAALDEAAALLADVDTTTLPEPVQQALALISSAGATVDQLLAALGADDPDEPEDPAAEAADAAAKAASTASAADREALADRMRATRARAYAALAAAYEKTGH